MSAPPPTATVSPSPRLLFVGADTSVPRLLREQLGERLAVVDVSTAEAALAALAEQPFDALLVQARLGQGSGNAVLGLAKREHPSVIRCLLLESGRDAPALAALDNLHRLYEPPLDAEALLVGLDAVLALRRHLESPRLAEAIGRVGRLPPPPALSLELMRRTEDLEVAAKEVAGLVESDPSLAAKVLRLCNSAMYSGGRRIDDIQTAVVWLGNLTLRRLVLAGEVFGPQRSREEDADHERLRETSLLASRLAGRLLPGPRADLAATAALLAGVGRLLPGLRLPWAPPPESAADTPTYAEAGAYLLGLWGLPERLVEAAAHHVDPASAGEVGLGPVGACHVAWALLGDVPLDTAWLEAQGLAGELDTWQALADDVRGEG